jgi:hypothetical protein
MATLMLEPSWTFKVTNTEMRLILQALGGRLHGSDETKADQLCDQLTQQRVNQVRETLKQIDGLEKALHGKT